MSVIAHIRLATGREFRGLALAYAGIFCLSSVPAGATIGLLSLLGAGFGHPSVAVGGLLCYSLLRLMETLAGRTADVRLAINALLIGMGVGYSYELGLPFALLAAATAAFTLLCGAQAIAWAERRGLPVLSLTFAAGYILLQLSAPLLGGVASPVAIPELHLCPAIDAALPATLAAFLRNLAWLLFTPDVTVGVVIFGVIVGCSRQLALHGLWAFAVAMTLLEAWYGNPETARMMPGGFNFTLIGFAVGATFLRYGWQSFFWSTLTVTVATFLSVGLAPGLSRFGATPSTLPFVLSTLLTLGLLRRSNSPLLPLRVSATPEATAAEHGHTLTRFGQGPALELPFSVPVRVYQAFDGPWTHQGIWRYAYDFVKTTDDGRSHHDAGLELADYPLFGLPLLSPCAGEVVACRDDLPDNQPGWIDHTNNWGNYILLRCEDGLHVEMSHLRQYSLHVKKGDLVRVGQSLAQCGNSGYSAYPHLHLQVQVGAWLAEATLPFTFRCLRYDGRLHHACLPPVGTEVEAVAISDAASLPRFTLGECLRFLDRAPHRADQRIQWKVGRTTDAFGHQYLADDAGNILYYHSAPKGYLALAYHGDRDAALAVFARALPRLPNTTQVSCWSDHLPMALVHGWGGQEWRGLALAYGWPNLRRRARTDGIWRFDPQQGRIDGHANGLEAWSVCLTPDGVISISEGHRTITRLP